MANPSVRIALAQVMMDADIDHVCGQAAANGAAVVVFPEMFSNGYSRFDRDDPAARAAWVDAAVALDGAWLERFCKAARSHGLAIVATFLEHGDPLPFNTAVLIDRTGEIILHQRKRHICFFDNPEEACAPGTQSTIVRLNCEAGDIALGIMICMDREFPDVASDLVRQGVDIILVPNASPLMDDPEVGDVRVAGVRALAFQSAAGIAVANYPKPKEDGHSFAVDALGRIIAMGGSGSDIVIADFDLEAIRTVQKEDWFRRAR